MQAHRQPPEAVPPPAPAPAAEATSTAAAQRLLQAREFAGLVAGSVGGAAAQALVARQSTITQPADILSYCVEVIELLFRTGDVERFDLPQPGPREKHWQELWKRFYNTIAIEGRENPRCRMSHMPKRYWENMPEVKDLLRGKNAPSCVHRV